MLCVILIVSLRAALAQWSLVQGLPGLSALSGWSVLYRPSSTWLGSPTATVAKGAGQSTAAERHSASYGLALPEPEILHLGVVGAAASS